MSDPAPDDRPEPFPHGGTAEEKLRALVGYAVLAPSGHNAQPWLFRAQGDLIDLMADRSRALPIVDPHDRELVISCGAALECLVVAARGTGHALQVEIVPDPFDRDWIARGRLKGGEPPSDPERALFDAIPRRRSTRRPFDARPLPLPLLEDVAAAAAHAGAELVLVTDETRRAAVAALVAEGDRHLFADPAFRAELANWTHRRHDGSQDGLSGVSLGFPDILSRFGAMAIRALDLGETTASRDEAAATAGPTLGVLATAGDDQADWIVAARAASRALLTLAVAGATAAVMSQPIGVEALRPRLAALAAARGVPQLLFRMGYGLVVPASARRPVEDVLVD